MRALAARWMYAPLRDFFVRFSTYLALSMAGLTLAACATANETNPARTATEQLLVAHAAERAAQQFAPMLPPDAKVYLDPNYFRGEGSDYALSAVRETLVSRGSRIANTLETSDVVIEIRLGALSIDKMNRVVGVPRLTLPITSDLNTVTIPELSLYSRRDRSGVAEFSAFAYETKSGKPVFLATRVAGETRIRNHTLFMIFSWGAQEVRPGDQSVDPLPWWKIWSSDDR